MAKPIVVVGSGNVGPGNLDIRIGKEAFDKAVTDLLKAEDGLVVEAGRAIQKVHKLEVFAEGFDEIPQKTGLGALFGPRGRKL